MWSSKRASFTDNLFTLAAPRTMHFRPLFLAALTFSFLISFPARAQVEPTPGNGLVIGTYCCSTSAPSNSIIVSGTVAIGTSTETTGTALDLGSNTNSMLLPSGTSAQRPSPTSGMLRYNSSVPQIEAYYGGAWNALTTSGATVSDNLGTSAGATNPQRTSEAGTGLFSANSGQVSVSSLGTDVGDFAAAGLNLPGTTTSYKLNGINAHWQDNTNFNTAVGPTALPTTISQAGGGFKMGSPTQRWATIR